jgi:hypothetical protein
LKSLPSLHCSRPFQQGDTCGVRYFDECQPALYEAQAAAIVNALLSSAQAAFGMNTG